MPSKAVRSKECAGYTGEEMTAPNMEEMIKLIVTEGIVKTLQVINVRTASLQYRSMVSTPLAHQPIGPHRHCWTTGRRQPNRQEIGRVTWGTLGDSAFYGKTLPKTNAPQPTPAGKRPVGGESALCSAPVCSAPMPGVSQRAVVLLEDLRH